MLRGFVLVSLLVSLPVACACGCSELTRANKNNHAPTAAPAVQRSVEPKVAAHSQRKGAPLGINLTRATFWSGNWPFVDAMKAAPPFFSGTRDSWRDGRPLEKDGFGWVKSLAPGQVARTFVIGNERDGVPFPVPAGDYVVLYDGKGTIEYEGNCRVIRKSRGRDVVRLGNDGTLIMKLTHVSPRNHLRNIRVIFPGGRCAGHRTSSCTTTMDCGELGPCVPLSENYRQQIFHPQFLAEIGKFTTLRFMDWMDTNRESALRDGEDERPPLKSWKEYPEVGSAHWHPVPVDVMVDLANELRADPWFTVPHAATDDFVEGMAKRVVDRLDPDLTVYVEYSNELWNYIFDQHTFAAREGCRRFSADPVTECKRPGDRDLCDEGPWDAWNERCFHYSLSYQATRTVEVMHIWRKVFTDRGRKPPTRVLGGQIGRAEDLGRRMLDHPWNGTEPTYAHIDAYAVAPYFGPWWSDDRSAHIEDAFVRNDSSIHGTPPGTFRVLSGGLESTDGGPISWLRTDADFLASRPEYAHIRLIGYEGGQHFFDRTNRSDPLDRAINGDPRMRDVYRQWLEHWSKITDDALLVVFASPGAGTWGSKEYQGQPLEQAPKHAAIEAWLDGRR